MHHSHWGLRESPYRDGLDPRYFYQSPVHNEALARLHFLVEQRRRVGLLLGEGGTGKSLVLEVFTRDMRRAGIAAARVDAFGIDRRELLWQTAAAWGVNPRQHADGFDLWRGLCDCIAEFRFQKKPCVLLLDDSDEATPEVMQEIVRLAAVDPTADSPLSLVLAAHPSHVDRISPRLLDLAVLRIDLAAWNEEDTASFLQESLARAGRDAPAFGASATHRLHELTSGVPRRVSQLADLALLAGASEGVQEIGPETVEAVYEELGVG